MTSFTPANQPFLNYLNVQKTPYVFLTAETDDFDEVTLQAWRDEGFVVNYVPLGNGGTEYIRRLHHFADTTCGVSEHYAIVGKDSTLHSHDSDERAFSALCCQWDHMQKACRRRGKYADAEVT